MACVITNNEFSNNSVRPEISSGTIHERVEATFASTMLIEGWKNASTPPPVSASHLYSATSYIAQPRIVETGTLTLARGEEFEECGVYAMGGTAQACPKCATLIFIADSNHADTHRMLNYQKVINKLLREGDIVLIEGEDPAKEYPQERLPMTLTKKVHVSSWDDPKIIQQCLRALATGSGSATALAMSRNESLVRNVQTRLSSLGSKQHIFVLVGGTHLNDALLSHFEREPHVVFYFYGQERTAQSDAAYTATLINAATSVSTPASNLASNLR